MLHRLTLIGATCLLLVHTPRAVSQELSQESPPDPLGICKIGNLSGRTIVDSSGRLVSLIDFCRQQTQQVQQAQRQMPSTAADEAFWQTFQMIASPNAVQFSQSIDRQRVIEYGAAVCPILQQGGTLQQVRQIQTQSRLPLAFDAAVNVAAIQTYCPQYRSQIGR